MNLIHAKYSYPACSRARHFGGAITYIDKVIPSLTPGTDVATNIQSRWRALIASSLLSMQITSGCTTFHEPPTVTTETSGPIRRVEIRNLHCPTTGRFVAVGGKLSLVSASEGDLLYSDDRGAAWHLAAIAPRPTTPLTLLKFPDEQGRTKLFLVPYSLNAFQPGQWWMSLDEGKSWGTSPPQLSLGSRDFFEHSNPSPRPLGAGLVSLESAPSTLAYVTYGRNKTFSDHVTIMRSTDRGKTWEPQELRLPEPTRFPDLISDGQGNAVLRLIGMPKILPPLQAQPTEWWFWTNDAGRTWGSFKQDHLANMALFYAPSGVLITFNASQRKYGNTLIKYSLNSGQTFEMSEGAGDSGKIIAIDEDQRGRIVAVTEYGRILVSDNQGRNWRITGKAKYKGATSLYRSGIVFSTGDTMIVLLGRGMIMRSDDRGETWVSVRHPALEDFESYSTHCSDDQGLIIASGSGMILRSTNWGITWNRAVID